MPAIIFSHHTSSFGVMTGSSRLSVEHGHLKSSPSAYLWELVGHTAQSRWWVVEFPNIECLWCVASGALPWVSRCSHFNQFIPLPRQVALNPRALPRTISASSSSFSNLLPPQYLCFTFFASSSGTSKFLAFHRSSILFSSPTTIPSMIPDSNPEGEETNCVESSLFC